MKKISWILILLLLPTMGMTAVTHWQIIPNQSSVAFTASQNNSPVTGQFKSFSGTIDFDPEQLSKSKVTMIINTGSVSTSYKDVADTLKSADWFDIKDFSQAIFKTNIFTKTGDKSYQAKGTLTLAGKTAPVTVNFDLTDYSQNTAQATGSASLKRTLFGIGKGEWSSTENVKDDVQVNFTLKVKK